MPENYQEENLEKDEKKVVRDLKIITAISVGKDRNKDIAELLDTDKSFASKKINKLCEEGLIFKEGEGKDTRYRLNPSRILGFLQRRVVIKWERKEKLEE